MSDVETKTFRELSESLLDQIVDLENRIFEKPYSRDKIERELSRKNNLIAGVAYVKAKPVGFKVGFEMTTTLLYSWIGGVVQEARGLGIAKTLMTQQHQLASELGFQFVRTETENRFKPMLVLNLRCGFDIVGVRTSEQYPHPIIVLEKKL